MPQIETPPQKNPPTPRASDVPFSDRPKCELIAAPYTPFSADGSVNYRQVGPYVELLLSQGVSGAFICGTTGEGASLTCRERKALAEEWMKAAAGRLDVIVHIGHNCLEDAVELGRHAGEIQAAGIAALAPSFFCPENEQILVACCAKMAASAPSMPFYYYHLPSMTHTGFPVSRWMEQAGEMIPNFRGVKFTYEDLADFKSCLDLAAGKFKCYFGRDELFLQGLQAGARAAVGSTYNYAGRLYVAIDEAIRAGNLAEAERLQKIACSFISVLSEFGFFGAAKSLMAFAGVDCGAPRLPLSSFPKERKASLLERLEKTGLLAFVPHT